MKLTPWILGLIVPIWILRPTFAADVPQTVEHLESLNREKAIQLALERHPKIAKSEAHIRQSQARLNDARRWFRPRVSVYGGERFDTDSRRFGIQVSHDLDALWDRTRAHEAEAARLIAEQELALTRQVVVAEVSAAYDEWALARMELHSLHQHRDLALERLKRAHNQYEEGLVSSSQVAELEKSLSEAEHTAAQASSHLSQAALRLRQAMGELGAP